MPRTKRDQLKRELAQVLNNLDMAAYGLAYFVRLFKEPHPDMAKYLETMCKQVLTLKEAGLTFWEWAWGKKPSDYNIWR